MTCSDFLMPLGGNAEKKKKDITLHANPAPKAKVIPEIYSLVSKVSLKMSFKVLNYVSFVFK